MNDGVLEKNVKPPIKCAIYARSATGVAGSATIEDQIRSCRQFSKSKGWKVVDSHVYVDAPASGLSKTNRVGLANLESAISQSSHPIDCVLIEEPSGLSRNLRELVAIMESWKRRYGVDIHFVNPPNNSRGSALMTLTMFSAADQHIVKNLRNKLQRGVQGRFRQGFTAGSRRMGYPNVPVVGIGNPSGRGSHLILGYKLQPIEPEASTVRRIFDLFADGLTTSQIAADLNSEKVSCDRESRIGTTRAPWDSAKLKRILQNPLYVGKRVLNKSTQIVNPTTGKRVTRRNPPESWIYSDVPELRIVSDEVWSRVQSRISGADV